VERVRLNLKQTGFAIAIDEKGPSLRRGVSELDMYRKVNCEKKINHREEEDAMRINFLFRAPAAILVFVVLGGCAWNVSAQSQAPSAAPTLYRRLGGYDAIAAVSDDFIGRLAADKQLARFLVGLSADSQKKLRQHVVDQLCEATGGPCIYIGRTMKTSHAGLGITEADWQSTVKHLVATLDKFKVSEKEKGELLAIAASLKADIVEKK
jgi:hemoglobin